MSDTRRLFFTKMEGTGNDYIYIDALGSPTSIDIGELSLHDLACKISNRHFGVGSDGLIVILPSHYADFRMRIFNADGSEAQMCGNGSRCVAKYVHDKGFTDKTTLSLETVSGVKTLYLHIEDGKTKEVTVDMGKAILSREDIPVLGQIDEMMVDFPVSVAGETFKLTAVGMGNPHGVVFVNDITDKHVQYYGRLLEVAEIWPHKANIEFVKVVDRTHLVMRVWERGSGETLSCGTGACASVVASVMKGLTDSEVEVKLLGGKLFITYNRKSGHVYMRGGANFIAEGTYYYNGI
ncbi:MAG: diaminopimelate epimerase [Bacteroides sp.]|nr:diaminopimelate epimerase [Bacteroides sp.]